MRELTSQQKAVVIAIRLYRGERLRAAPLAKELGMSERGIYRLLDVLSTLDELPIFSSAGEWQKVESDALFL